MPGIWGVPEGGECLRCFRSLPLSSVRSEPEPLPSLDEISLPSHPYAPVFSAFENMSKVGAGGEGPAGHSYRALLARVSNSGGCIVNIYILLYYKIS